MCRWKVDPVFKIVNRDGGTSGRKKHGSHKSEGDFLQNIIIDNYYTPYAYLSYVVNMSGN